MTASDYGGGIPIADVWRRDCGLAVGHLETRPRLLSLPVRRTAGGVRIAIAGATKVTLAAGEEFQTPRTFLAVHTGDYFRTLDLYRLRMAEQGMCAPRPPASAYEAIWCAWGYERECTVALIEGTLPKVRELGLSWAVVDDGWQTNVGDWNLDPRKYPRGDADMQQLVHDIRSHSLKPRLWITPLAAAPGSDLLHEHSDMLLLDKNGAPQLVTWWNCLYLCPAYAKTVAYYEGLVRRILGTWGYAGIKVDGQQLNGVAPCYNPLHHHERPEESVEGLQDFLAALYATAMRIDPAGGHGAVSLRHRVFILQSALRESGAGLRPRVLLAGTSQGQDAEGPNGRPRRPLRGTTWSSATAAMTSPQPLESAPLSPLSSPGPTIRSPRIRFFSRPSAKRCGASGSRSITSGCCRRAPTGASSTTSALTDRRGTSSTRMGGSTMHSSRAAGMGR